MGIILKKALTNKNARNKKALKELALNTTSLLAWGVPS
jgi:hypothetical protein